MDTHTVGHPDQIDPKTTLATLAIEDRAKPTPYSDSQAVEAELAKLGEVFALAY